jgi:hypothetical protein
MSYKSGGVGKHRAAVKTAAQAKSLKREAQYATV